MKILQLCCFTNYWGNGYDVESWDIKNGKDVLKMDDDYGKNFDFIISAPPCTQFTLANSRNWEEYPEEYIKIVRKCLKVSESSGKKWILENVPGRIVKLVPELKKYRIGTWRSKNTTKKHLIFGNQIVILEYVDQRKNEPINKIRKKELREMWECDFIKTIKNSI